MAVSEWRCLPQQSGFTIEPYAVNFPMADSAFSFVGVAGHDLTVTERSCSGWYWCVPAVIFVGLAVRFGAFGAMHGFYRAEQTKKPLLKVIGRERKTLLMVIIYFLILAGLMAAGSYFMFRNVHYIAPEQTASFLLAQKYFQ